MAFDKTKLRGWLRQSPHPAEIRIRTPEDEERIIAISPNFRTRWKQAEAAVLSAKAKAVECLDKKGAIIRSCTLVDEEDEISGDSSTDTGVTHMKAVASMLDRYGDRMNEAFDRGAAAASVAQENMIALVETLTGHLSLAITNLHNVSVNLANAISGTEGEPGDKNRDMLVNVLGAAAVKAIGGVPVPQQQQAPPPPNGGKK